MAEHARRVVETGSNFLLDPDIARLGAEVVAHQVRDLGGQYLPQPVCELRLVGSLEQLEIPVRFQERFLNEIGRIELSLQTSAKLKPGQQPKVSTVAFQ